MKLTNMVAVLAIGAGAAQSANAANVTLSLVDSFARTNAFGLAYDGTNIWWSNSSGVLHEMTTSGVDTGNTIIGPYWGADAWNGSKLVTISGGIMTAFDRSTASGVSYTALHPITTTLAGASGGLIDGFDIKGSTAWWSPDVGAVYTSPADGTGSRSTFLGGAGGYSGVEYVSGGGSNYVIVVNDASSPRRLCVHDTTGTEIGCTALANSRYEDLAFDGRYLYAADFYGNRIDKIDVFSNGGSIFVPPPVDNGVPEPASAMVMTAGAVGLGFRLTAKRRR